MGHMERKAAETLGRVTVKVTRKGHYEIFAGEHRIAIITAETPTSERARFIAVCEQHAQELEKALQAREEKIQWNRNNRARAKNHPEFVACERLINKMLKMAGVKNS